MDIGVSHGNNQPSREDSEGSEHCVIAKTRRLILREFKADDLDEIYSVCDSWGEVPGLLPLSDDRDEEREKLESYIHFMYGFYGMGLWAICLAADGRMIGFGCGMLLLTESVLGIGMNLGVFPSTTVCMPFLAYGFCNSVVYAVLCGFILSICRYRNVLTEHNMLRSPEKIAIYKN